MKRSVVRLIITSFLVSPFISCGDDASFSSDVDFDSFPNTPIVFENDIEIPDGAGDTRTIQGPWFLGGFTIRNRNPDYELRIPSLSVTYRGIKSGITNEGETVLDSSICSDDDTPRINYALVGPGGEVFYGDSNCNATNEGILDRELIYFPGLPEADGTSYFVTVTLDGYMFDSSSNNDPIKGRVKKIISFTTQ